MKNISPLRRGTVVVAALVAGLVGAVTAGTTSSAVAATSATPSAAAVRHQTRITFEVPDCDGCTLELNQGRWDEDAKWGARVWESREKRVRDGHVTFTVAPMRTKGMSVLVRAPWERHINYVTTVAFRYGGMQPGDEVGFREARSKSKASACWAGTRADEVTVPLTVRKVWVEGIRGNRVRGSIAYTSTTQDWMVPMRDVWDGVMGSQDMNICGER